MNALGETSRANTFSKCGEGGPISMRHTQERRGGDYDGRQPRAGTEAISSCSTLPSAHSGPLSFSLSLMMRVEPTKQMLSAAYLQENARPLQSVCWATSHSKSLNTFGFWLRNEIKSSVVSSGFSQCSSQSFKNFWPFPYWAPNVISWASDWKTDASTVAVSTVESHKPSQQCVDGAVSPSAGFLCKAILPKALTPVLTLGTFLTGDWKSHSGCLTLAFLVAISKVNPSPKVGC